MTVFAITAVTTASLAARVREQAHKALVRERDMAVLLKASELVSHAVDSDETLINLVRETCTSYNSSYAAIFELSPDTRELRVISSFGEYDANGEAHRAIVENAARAITQNTLTPLQLKIDSQAMGIYAPIYHQGDPMGVLYVSLDDTSEPADRIDTLLLATLASHAAIVIARKHASEEALARIKHNTILDERRRLAHEVHDTLSNTFNGIKFLLEASKGAKTTASVEECVDLALGLAVEGAQEARRSVWSLRPVAFGDSGTLVHAIQHLGEIRTDKDHDLVNIVITGKPVALDHDIEDNLYRIAQEAVTNAIRHSQATKITLSLSYAPNYLELTVEDNGIGFDTHRHEGIGFGIENMCSRSKQIGAEITITSAIDTRTLIVVRVGIE
jgi:signal transduction histidine kinase